LTEDERLDEMFRRALAESRHPPEPPLDEMWAQVERRAFDHAPVRSVMFARTSLWATPALAAAALVLGVALGRYVIPRVDNTSIKVSQVATSTSDAAEPVHHETVAGTSDTASAVPSVIAATTQTPDAGKPDSRQRSRTSSARLAARFEDLGGGTETSRYLAQTGALLASLPSGHTVVESDTAIAVRAEELLTQTHLLLDSQAGSDPTLHRLLEDLELVLAQVARLRTPRNGSDLQLIHQALAVRDVIPRVHDASVEASIND
jgi:hypothetical protein